MPVIPRSQRQVGPSPTMLRQISGAGFSAPGRAVQQLGSAIGSLAGAFDSKQKEIDQYNTSKALMQFKIDQDQKQFEAGQNIQGDGQDFVQSSMSRFDNDFNQVLQTIPEANRNRAELAGLRLKSGLQNQAQSSQHQYQQSYFADETSRMVSTGVIPSLQGDVNQYGQRLAAADQMIDSTPVINHRSKIKLKQQAAQSAARQWLDNVDPDDGIEQIDTLVKARQEAAKKGKGKVARSGIDLSKASLENVAEVAEVARANNFDPDLAVAIAHFESAGTFSTTKRPVSKRGTMMRGGKRVLSSAEGIFQFLDASKKQYGYGTTARDQTVSFIKKNNSEVNIVQSRVNRKLQPWERYLVHFQGPGGAAKLLKADTNARVESVVGQKVANANAWMKGKTVGQFLGRVKNEIESRMANAGAGEPVTTTELFNKHITENSEALKKTLQNRLAEQEREVHKKHLMQEKVRGREGYELLAEGKLNPDWVDRYSNELSEADYKRFVMAANRKPVSRTDPQTYIDLIQKVEKDPKEALDEAMDAYNNGLLSKGAFDRIYSDFRKHSEPESVNQPRFATEARTLLKSSMRPKKDDADGARDYMDTLNEYDDFVKKVMENTNDPKQQREAIQGKAEELVGKTKQRRRLRKRSALEIPPYTNATRETMDETKLQQAMKKLLEARNKKQISHAEFLKKSVMFKRWADLLEDEANDR